LKKGIDPLTGFLEKISNQKGGERKKNKKREGEKKSASGSVVNDRKIR